MPRGTASGPSQLKLETALKIEIANPPNFDKILTAFPHANRHGVIFAYGDTIYNPSGIVIPPPLVAHEEVHGRRQTSPEKWWLSYIADPEFRYNEELYAHAAELLAFKKIITDRNQRAKLMMTTAQRLLAPLYNYGVPKSLNQAICDLRFAVEHR